MTALNGPKIIAAAIFICVISVCAVSPAEDEIILKAGDSLKGSILKTGKAGITIELSGSKAVMLVAPDKIKKMNMEIPASFRTAENSYFSGNYEQAFQDYMKTIERCGGFAAGEDAYFKAADCQVKLGNKAKAIGIYEEYIAGYSDAKTANKARMKLAEMLTGNGDNEGAIKIYDDVIRSKDEANRPDAYYGIAEAYYAKGDYEKALVNYLKIAVLYYDKGMAVNAKFKSGACYEKLGESKMALATYKEIREEYPNSEFAGKSEVKIKETEKDGK